VDPTASLNDVQKRKFLTLLGLELRAVSRYTDYAPTGKGNRGNRQITFLLLYITDPTDISLCM
jgi:hypothetical protein